MMKTSRWKTVFALKRIFSAAMMIAVLGCARNSNPEVRPSALAGRWYPADGPALASMIDSLLGKAGSPAAVKDPLVFVLPHAGYVYSGEAAAHGYAVIKGMDPGVVVILAPPHQTPVRGCALSPADYFETPLGRVKVDRAASVALASKPGFMMDAGAHRMEHAVEIHLPFLQRIFGDKMEGSVPILPVLVGDIRDDEASGLAASIAESVKGRRPLFIVSSDFTHYGPRFGYTPFRASGRDDFLKKQKELDMGAIGPILKKDRAGFSAFVERTGITVCGQGPIRLALSLPASFAETKLLKYDTSCGISGDCDNSVSYAAIALGGTMTGESGMGATAGALSSADQEYLLRLARRNIRSLLFDKKRAAARENEVPEACRTKRGVFVTLKKGGELRGCIGTVIAEKQLWELVLENSYNAAFRDPRFSGLQRSELDSIVIEISVLTVPTMVASVDEIEVGRDGLIIMMGGRSGLLLPQVPVEQGWTREQFLVWVCRKAGLPDNAWRTGARLYRFQAQVFGERRG